MKNEKFVYTERLREETENFLLSPKNNPGANLPPYRVQKANLDMGLKLNN